MKKYKLAIKKHTEKAIKNVETEKDYV